MAKSISIISFFLLNTYYLIAQVIPDYTKPFISEIMAINSNILKDSDADNPDWIEIYNPTEESVNLKSWALTDNPNTPLKWLFPDIKLAPKSYLLVFASGKDKTDSNGILHTNFKLSGDGEYLALVEPNGGGKYPFYGETFPSQTQDISFGVFNSEYIYFLNPTPCLPNKYDEFLPEPKINISRGFFEKPFFVELSSDLKGVTIRYTTDGSLPKETSKIYGTPVNIKTTTTLRARLFKEGTTPGATTTHTYIFTNDVSKQPNNPYGYPKQWGPYETINGYAIADYGMDPEIVNHPDYKDQIVPGLLSLPTISIVTDKDNLFSDSTDPDKGGIYIYTGPPTGGLGNDWERPASVEYILPDGDKGFQANCGLMIQGGHGRLPEKSPKHSFRLVFRNIYGQSVLNYKLLGDNSLSEFNNINIKASFGYTWIHWTSSQREKAQYLRDTWAKDTQLAMNQPAVHNKYINLYINGLYWGLYLICERIDKDFVDNIFKGKKSNYDVIKDYSEIIDGKIDSWNSLISKANKGLSENKQYFEIQGKNEYGNIDTTLQTLVDIDNLIDYMIINFYMGNTDWDHHNWAVAKDRTDKSKGFIFFCWDSENIFIKENENVVGKNNPNCPSSIFQELTNNQEFRIRFADRVQKYFFNDGLLTPKQVTERWMKRAKEIELAVIDESARWGDYRRDVHPWSSAPYELYTKNDFWLKEQQRLVNEYFPVRTNIVLDQLRNANLFPKFNAPVFSTKGGIIEKPLLLHLMADSGIIYYTTDGSDPRETGGTISANAIKYIAEFEINKNITIRARAKQGNEWSAITQAKFETSKDFNPVKINDLYNFDNQHINNLKLWPNPTMKYSNIAYSLSQTGYVNISIKSIDGRNIQNVFQGFQYSGNQLINIKTEKLLEGVYLINIKFLKNINNQELIEQHNLQLSKINN